MNALYGPFDNGCIVKNTVFCLNVLVFREGNVRVWYADPFEDFHADAG